jgi:hypothetical protein
MAENFPVPGAVSVELKVQFQQGGRGGTQHQQILCLMMHYALGTDGVSKRLVGRFTRCSMPQRFCSCLIKSREPRPVSRR